MPGKTQIELDQIDIVDIEKRQTALNALTDVASASNDYVLTKDTATGNAVFKINTRASSNIDGGAPSSIYTINQNINGGTP